VKALPFHDSGDETSELDELLDRARNYAVISKLCPPGRDVIVVSGLSTGDAESLPSLTIRVTDPGQTLDRPHGASAPATLSRCRRAQFGCRTLYRPYRASAPAMPSRCHRARFG
jgi:hypothetical protein